MEQGELPPPPRRWFAIDVRSAHVEGGSKKEIRHTNFVLATDALDAFKRARRMRGWKRTINRGKGRIPGIRQLTAEEESLLKDIVKEDIPGLTWDQVRRDGFLYGRRKDLDINVAKILQERVEEKRKKE